jgi:hypothetical protein
MVGATHEFQDDALSLVAVEAELNEKTVDFSSRLWKHATVLERWTMGYRVQSERDQLGRLPIIGRLPSSTDATDATDATDTVFDERLLNASMIHANTWIFTGLSSRGLYSITRCTETFWPTPSWREAKHPCTLVVET